jgi:two-component system, sensor histidine kinase PdtaS
MLRAWRKWPVPISAATTIAAVVAACLFQLPIERHVPGEPFLLFILVVIAATLAFGARLGFLAVGLSTILSALFFEPVGTFALWHAADLIKIELYAVLASCSVVAFARLANMVIAAREDTDSLKRLNEGRSVLLRELAHGVANNFAAVAAFMSARSNAIDDAQARSVLNEAVEQIRMMGRVHARLRVAGDHHVSLGSQDFFESLCDELKASLARGRQISIECEADDLPLSADQAISLGLIVNELVMNAVKHAFPDGRKGRIHVGFEVVPDDQLRLCVEDDGVGLAPRQQRNGGLGQDLVNGLSRELGGRLEVKPSEKGSCFHLRIPYTSTLR